MKKIVFTGLFLGILGGCYTQFSTLDEKGPPPPKVTYEIDSATGDTVKVISPTDTIVRKENQTCYWTRNLWGEPELRCDNSFYSQDWYLYNDYPWWFNRDPYMYDAYGRCPQYYYYDESCRSCRYYTDRNYYNNGSGFGGGRSSSSAPSSGGGGTRHTRSSGVPSQSIINSSSSQSLPKQEISSGTQNTSQGTQTDPSRRTRSSAVPSSETIQETTPSYINQTPVAQTRTDAQVPVAVPPAQPINQPSPPPPDQSNTNLQSSPPPSPPPNTSGGQNDNNQNRRNPRSW
ncbi:MAG: hypothetical protein WBM07_00640 [Chitinivibrionales bacterium]